MSSALVCFSVWPMGNPKYVIWSAGAMLVFPSVMDSGFSVSGQLDNSTLDFEGLNSRPIAAYSLSKIKKFSSIPPSSRAMFNKSSAKQTRERSILLEMQDFR